MDTQDSITSQEWLWQNCGFIAGLWKTFSVWSHIGWASHSGGNKRPLCCHLLELQEEECEGKEQILFACPVDVISCGWEDNKTLFSLLCASRTAVCQVQLGQRRHTLLKMPALNREAVQLAPTTERKGKRDPFSYGQDTQNGRGSSLCSSMLVHCFCSPVTVLSLNIWGNPWREQDDQQGTWLWCV